MANCPCCQHVLPDPPERFCPNCGGDCKRPHLHRPASAAFRRRHRAGRAARGGTPWERRSEIGFVAALVETTQQVLTGPDAFFRSMPVSGGIGRRWSTA